MRSGQERKLTLSLDPQGELMVDPNLERTAELKKWFITKSIVDTL